MPNITTRALCIIEHKGKLLASINTDPTSGQQFYRLIGGGVEFGETGEAAVRREIMEELGSELENLQLVTMLENIFVYDGKPGHEIVFLSVAIWCVKSYTPNPKSVLWRLPTS